MHTAAKLVKRGSGYFTHDKEGAAHRGGNGAGATGGEPGSLHQAVLQQQHREAGQVESGEAGPVKAPAMTPEDSLRAYELFEALRTFEPGTSNTDALFKTIDAAPVTETKGARAMPTPLHTAIRCAKTGTVDLVLRHRPQDINARDLEGRTPLHIATSHGRTDVVMLLLSQPAIDDSIRDTSGRTAIEVAKGSEVAKVMQVSRAQYSETYSSLLSAYVTSPGGASDGTMPPRTTAARNLPLPSTHLSPNVSSTDAAISQAVDAGDAREALMTFLKKDRSKNIDFSMLTSGSRGTTIIHEASRRKDIDMLKLCAGRGASMVVRDRKGKMALEVAKDDTVKSLLRQGATSEGRALRTSVSLASGVSGLAGGPAASSTNTAGGGAGQGHAAPPVMKGYLSKWTNMARGYRNRWFVLHHGHISYYRDMEEEGHASRGTISMAIATVEQTSSDKTTFTIGTSLGKSPKWFLKGNHPVETMQWINALKSSIDYMKSAEGGGAAAGAGAGGSPNLGLGLTAASGGSGFVGRTSSANNSNTSLSQPSTTGGAGGLGPASGFSNLDRSTTSRTAASVNTDFDPNTRTPSPQMTEGSVYGDDEGGGGAEGSRHTPPHQDNFDLLSNSAKVQLGLTGQLVSSLSASDADPARRRELVAAAERSLRMISAMLDQHLDQIADREKWFNRRYEREMEAKRMWEENMRSVVSSQAELEQQLADTHRLNSKRKRALKDLKQSVLADMALNGGGEVGTPTTPGRTMPNFEAQSGILASPPASARTPGEVGTPVASTRLAADLQALDDIVSDSSDDEDFYDAVESGAVPVRVETPIATPNKVEWPVEMKQQEPERVFEMQKEYEGYRHLRDRLPMASDERPPVSLWAILKGSIGKDLTKISFPVYFNEPTSMLQRMAEDMEYSECLDAASAEQDSLKRLAFVTGFAMSNYASTIGRIAKPFNPMLSETFELANLDKKYRYMSEQVSHHPPMSACIAESPTWNYYGEVDAKSKFLGKSFEIRPTGVAHADLLLPQAWGPNYPPSATRAGYVKEHYSWKKVTTSISNFIMGAPQIDHYGDMEVTNHRTGERCVLTFKPRGWRGNNACEVKGNLYDNAGNLQWELAGRWNGQLVARKAGAGAGVLQPDDKVPTTSAAEYLLIWKINQQPPNMPFNLTRFALTLNDANPEIKKYLPPTDCRLRPDQHAFEDGKFEKANELKGALETFQRGTRLQREQGELPAHKPRWFVHTIDKDSEQSVWEPLRQQDGSLEYWKERNTAYKAVVDGKEPHWSGVEKIFGITI